MTFQLENTCRLGLVKNHQKNLIRLSISYMVRYIIWGRPAKKSTHLSQNRPSATTFSFMYCKTVQWDMNFWLFDDSKRVPVGLLHKKATLTPTIVEAYTYPPTMY